MSKRFSYLNNEERSEIEILKNKGYSLREIGKVLGRSPNTISYELKRCRNVPYRAELGKVYARVKVTHRRLQWSKIESTEGLKAYVIGGLKKHWNPDEISGRMKKDKMPWYVSKSAIYQWLDTVRGERYKKYLYGERPGRRHKKKDGLHGQILHMTPIESRSVGNTERSRYGHFETDLIISGRNGTGGLSTSIERKSRYLHALKVENQTAQVKQNTLQLLTETCSVKSITFDRGHENAKHYELGIPTYFCNPYHSWEKGSVENANKMIRRYYPKKTDFSTVSQEEIDHIVSIINNKPRKILKYATSTEVAVRGGVINRVS
jgi:transposase, IS30 family